MELGTGKMKLAVFCVCALFVTCATARIFNRNNLQATHNTRKASRAPAPPSTGALNQGKQRTLFARRGQYERQSVPKPRVVPVRPNHPPPPPPSPKVTPKPVKLTCSHLTQSCLPSSGCCEPQTTCRCRFFNAICFCWRTN